MVVWFDYLTLNGQTQSVNYSGLIGVLIKEIQTLKKK